MAEAGTMPPSVDEEQIGGDHYKSAYQHWDFVYEALGGDYFKGNVTKYIARARKKNGVEDLEKARHYARKAGGANNDGTMPVDMTIPYDSKLNRLWQLFCSANELNEQEGAVILSVMIGKWAEAVARLTAMIDTPSA